MDKQNKFPKLFVSPLCYMTVLILLLLAWVFPGVAFAQSTRNSTASAKSARPGQEVISPGLKHNIGDIAAMMLTIHKMLHLGPLTPKQDTAVSDMMIRLGVMMKEMSRPHGPELDRQHERELQEMRRRVEIIKKQLKSQ